MTLLRDLLPEAAVVPGMATAPVAGLQLDSRKVERGDVFFAIPGAKSDGSGYAAQAIERGAAAIVSQTAIPNLDPKVPALVVPDVRVALAEAAARFFPNQPSTIAAVTGTSGKTSVAAFVRQIWAPVYSAASLGTVGLVTPQGDSKGELTTPDTITLHQTLDRIARDGVTHLVLEASSHGLDQKRLDGVRLKAGAFTNLSRDHMDYHATVEDYLAAKLRLFTDLLQPGTPAVVNVDNQAGRRVAESARGHGLDLLTVGRSGETLRLLSAEPDGFMTRIRISHHGRIRDCRLPLAGLFQVENALVAAGICLATGGDADAVFAALEHLKGAAGRLDLVGTTAQGAPVFVDYAHKPDALEKVLETLRPYTRGRLAVVVGCGGDRDPGKRPIMGAIAARLADRVIITDDNPRSENPAAIRAAMLAAAPGATEIGDRATAIETAVGALESGDILVVAGKGHELGQIVGQTVLPFSDHAAVKAALERHAS